MAAAPRKPKYRFLDRTALEDVTAEPVELEGVFQLTRPRFEPLTDTDVPTLDDGEKPTTLGKAVMHWWATANETDWRECPTPLVRAFEAVSATHDNVVRIREATKGNSVQWQRNHAGLFSAATVDVLVPVVGPAVVQPRDNAAYGRLLRNEYGQSLIHEIGEDLAILGDSAAHFEHIRYAQQEVIDPGAYRGERRDFVDSLALEGIREPLRGFAYRLVTADGQTGCYIETNDGYTRVAVAQRLIGHLLGGLPTDLSRLPWNNGDGTQSVRGWTADAIIELHKELDFPDAPFDVWPETETTAGVGRWLADASPEAEAVMRLMTARMSIGIKAKPYRRQSTHDVVYADMARFHVKGHQPAPWNANDDEAFKARTIVSHLERAGFIDRAERDVFLGAVEVPWQDDPRRAPYRSRLVATVDTMNRFVVEDPSEPERSPTVRRILKSMRVANSPTQAAAAAASLAVQVAGLEGSGEVGGFTAMVRRSFKSPEVRRLVDHVGDWTARITEDVSNIVEGARAELESVLDTSRHADYLGPNMRALALLAMVGHGMNPRLTEYRRPDGANPDGKLRTVRWPSSMTLTGRGLRGGATAAEAHHVVFHMVRSPKGIGQLEAIVRAVIDHAEPILPLDPQTGDPLLEDDLRDIWNRNPDRRGDPVIDDIDTGDEEPGIDYTGGDGDGHREVGLWEDRRWNEAVTRFRDELRGMAHKAQVLSQVPAGPAYLGLDENEWDPDDESLPRMHEKAGVDDDTANGFDDDVDAIRKFFVASVMAWLRNRMRS